MSRILWSLLTFAFLSNVCLSCKPPKYDDAYFEEQNRNSDCDNNCFWDNFPGGSCTDDPACMCTQQKYRENYFCCLGTQCAPSVLPDAVERIGVNCVQFNNPFTFDSEAVCGIEIAPSCAQTTVTTSTAESDDSQTSVASTPTAPSSITLTIPSTTGTGSPPTEIINTSGTLSVSSSSSSSSASGTSRTQNANGTATSSTPPFNEAPLNRITMNSLTFFIIAITLLLF